MWKPNEYTITYNYNRPSGVTANPGSWPANGNANHGTNYTISSNTPTLSGYRFDGWNTAANGSGTSYAAGGTISNVTTNQMLYAVWTALHTITYKRGHQAHGHHGQRDGPALQWHEHRPRQLLHHLRASTPSLSGAVFTGWNAAANGSGTAYAAGATINPGERQRHAVRPVEGQPGHHLQREHPGRCRERLSPSPGMPTNTTVTYNTPYTLPTTTPSVMGYTFAGWNTAANGSGTAYAAGVTTSNITTATTFYAQWTERTGFRVESLRPGARRRPRRCAVYDTKSNLNWTSNVTMPTAPTKTGYTFGGWYLQKDSNGSGTGTTAFSAKGFNALWLDAQRAGMADTSTTTIKLYAKWTELNRVSFTLDPNGGTYKGTTGVDTTSNILNWWLLHHPPDGRGQPHAERL